MEADVPNSAMPSPRQPRRKRRQASARRGRAVTTAAMAAIANASQLSIGLSDTTASDVPANSRSFAPGGAAGGRCRHCAQVAAVATTASSRMICAANASRRSGAVLIGTCHCSEQAYASATVQIAASTHAPGDQAVRVASLVRLMPSQEPPAARAGRIGRTAIASPSSDRWLPIATSTTPLCNEARPSTCHDGGRGTATSVAPSRMIAKAVPVPGNVTTSSARDSADGQSDRDLRWWRTISCHAGHTAGDHGSDQPDRSGEGQLECGHPGMALHHNGDCHHHRLRSTQQDRPAEFAVHTATPATAPVPNRPRLTPAPSCRRRIGNHQRRRQQRQH